MEKRGVIPATVDPVTRNQFYQLIGQVPETEPAWTERQATLRGWRADPRFEPYWPSIDQMLTDDFASFRHRVGAMGAVGHLEGYDYDAWREQREHDRKHARDRLP
jgi:hypothetical protein